MTTEFAESYGFGYVYNSSFACIAATSELSTKGINRWAKACEAMDENVGEPYGHFITTDFSAIYLERNPLKPDSENRRVRYRFTNAPKETRSAAGPTQEELAKKASIGMFALHSYGQEELLPRANQLRAVLEALDIANYALILHYFSNPNQVMRYLFAIAKAASLMLECSAKEGSRLWARGNMVERAFACMVNKLKEFESVSEPDKQGDNEMTRDAQLRGGGRYPCRSQDRPSLGWRHRSTPDGERSNTEWCTNRFAT